MPYSIINTCHVRVQNKDLQTQLKFQIRTSVTGFKIIFFKLLKFAGCMQKPRFLLFGYFVEID